MATIKIKFRASTVKQKEGTLFFQVIHNRVARQINAGLKLYPEEWDKSKLEVRLRPDMDEEREAYLLALQGQLEKDKNRLENIIVRMGCINKNFTAEQVVNTFIKSKSESLVSFTDTLIIQLREVRKERTAETYTTVRNSFIRFCGDREILLDDIDSAMMIEYETYLKKKGICPNTSSFYMRNLRAIYNRAVEKELTAQRHPFKYVYTGIGKTRKRAVSLSVIRKIRDLDLTQQPDLDLARDIFMFSFYTRGMSFIDMAFLKKKDLQMGILSYRRQKTHRQLNIKWEKPMQKIVAKYDTKKTPYMLPLIRNTDTSERAQYLNAAHLINHRLKKIGQLLNLPIPLTAYVARHAWASIAKSKNISLGTISEAMGHNSERTTQIYLASLDTSGVDKANMLILKSLQIE